MDVIEAYRGLDRVRMYLLMYSHNHPGTVLVCTHRKLINHYGGIAGDLHVEL